MAVEEETVPVAKLTSGKEESSGGVRITTSNSGAGRLLAHIKATRVVRAVVPLTRDDPQPRGVERLAEYSARYECAYYA